MAKVNVHIWHAANGQIVAVGRPISAKHKCAPVAGPGQFVFETEVEESHIPVLVQNHLVDLGTKSLVKRPPAKPSP